jgi:hypothetical protein
MSAASRRCEQRALHGCLIARSGRAAGSAAISSTKPDRERRGSATAASDDATAEELRELDVDSGSIVCLAPVFGERLEPLASLDELAVLAEGISPASRQPSVCSIGESVATVPCTR